MEISYIILAHKNPEQVYRLISRLNESWTRFYIHVDRKVDISPFKEIFKEVPNVFFLEEEQRELGTWGDVGIVRATINAMKQIVKEERTGYALLLTGQDYPLKNNHDIQSLFIEESGREYITLYPLPNDILHLGGKPRINRYKINKSPKRGHFLLLPSIFDRDFYKYETLGKLNFLRKSGKTDLIRKIFSKRRFPIELKAYAGGVYWALPIATVSEILEYIVHFPQYLKYHEHTLCADEIFFHSIIAQLRGEDIQRIKPSLTYVNWERKTGPLPVTFESEDFNELRRASENHLFARKFDIEKDSEILEIIDKKLRK